MEREFEGLPKYNGFRPTSNIAGVKDNIRMSVRTLNGKTSRGMSPDKAIVFTDGQRISHSFNLTEEIKNKYKLRLT